MEPYGARDEFENIDQMISFCLPLGSIWPWCLQDPHPRPPNLQSRLSDKYRNVQHTTGIMQHAARHSTMHTHNTQHNTAACNMQLATCNIQNSRAERTRIHAQPSKHSARNTAQKTSWFDSKHEPPFLIHNPPKRVPIIMPKIILKMIAKIAPQQTMI